MAQTATITIAGVGGTATITSSEISAAGSLSDLSLSELGTLGVDVIDIDGSTTDATLHIDSTDTLAMSGAELSFATGDNIVLDVTAEELADADESASGLDSAYDGTSSGSYLTGSLDSAVSGMFGGLGLSDLQALGVDVIDIDGSTTDATLHIDSTDALAMSNAELSFATGDTITQDVKAAELEAGDGDASA